MMLEKLNYYGEILLCLFFIIGWKAHVILSEMKVKKIVNNTHNSLLDEKKQGDSTGFKRWKYEDTMEFYDVNGNLLWKKLLPWCSKEYKFIPGKLLLLTALDGIFLLDIKDGKEIWYLKEDLDYWESFERGVPYEVKHALSLTPDNKVFAFAGSSGKEYIYFYTIEGKRLKKIYLGEAICKYAHHPMDCVGRIKKIHITNDGKVIIFQRGKGVLIYEFKIK